MTYVPYGSSLYQLYSIAAFRLLTGAQQQRACFISLLPTVMLYRACSMKVTAGAW